MSRFENHKTDYGFRLNVPGFLTPPEAKAWAEDLQAKVKELRGMSFGLLVDIRSQKANPPETQEIIKQMMVWLRKNGVQRSVVVVDNAVARVQIMRLAKETGTYAWERYLDASKDAKWEQKAVAWIVHGTDPDTQEAA